MDHIDPEVIALIAMGERLPDDEERRHLDSCAECARDLRQLTDVSHIGRASEQFGELRHPSPAVWEAIVEETVPEVLTLARVARRRRRLVAALAAVVVVVLVVGGIVVWNSVRASSVRELATATLAPFPAWRGASGSATVTELSDGKRQVVVTLTGEKANPNFNEVWLMTSNLKHLVSIGVITGSSATFTLPAGINLRQFDVVDVSSEPHDGNPQHSGNSIVRGELSS